MSITKGTPMTYWIKESIKDVKFEDVFEIGKELGSGATSVVYKCEHRGTRQPWAVKIVTKKVDKKVVLTEAGVLLKLRHNNVVSLSEIYETPQKIYLVLELVKGGELFERIVARGHYAESDAAKVMRQILEGLKHIHENGVCHRDLKPENLLYEDNTDDSNLKLADFGLSKIFDGEVQMNTVCGTPGYCAPEVLMGKKYNESVDLWSAGVIAFILLCGYEPFYHHDQQEFYKKILKVDYSFDPEYWDGISENAKDFVTKLLKKDPKERLTEQQALNHPWVTGKAAFNNHMSATHTRIKEFNARRRLKAFTETVLLTTKTMSATLGAITRQPDFIGNQLIQNTIVQATVPTGFKLPQTQRSVEPMEM